MTVPARPQRRPRRAFWLFALAMAFAVLGGGTIVLLNRRSVREYQAEQERAAAERAPAVDPRAGAKPDGRAAAAPGRSAEGTR
jgi:hypothetical protein